MGRFDRYLLSQLMTLFGFFSLILVTVYWINRAVRLFDQLIADGQSAWVFLEFTALSLPGIMASVLPLSTFVASLFVANKLITESELVVVQATGFSPWRLARPVFIFGLLATLLVQALSHVLVPQAQSRLQLRQYEVTQDTTARLLQEGQFINPIEGLTLYIAEVTPEGELKNVFLSDLRTPGLRLIYTAPTAYLIRTESGAQLVLRNGMVQRKTETNDQLGVLHFEDFAYDLGNALPTEPPSGRSYRELSTLELLNPTPELVAETGRSESALILAAHDRFAEPTLGLIGALLGFCTLLLGSFSRFGVWKQMSAAIGLVIAVKVSESLMTGLTRDMPQAWWLLYIPLLFGLCLTGILLHYAARPSRPKRIRKAA